MDKQQITKIVRKVLLIGIPVATLLHEVAILVSYDTGTNYFVANAPLPFITNLITMLLVAAAIACALITEKPTPTASPFGLQIWVAIPAALGFAISGVFSLLTFLITKATLSLIAAVLLLLSAIHMLLSETGAKLSFLGFFPPLACASLVCILYFDASLEMNAPMKVAVQCALLPLMLYFTAELRYLLGRELPRLYYALALGSLAVSSLCILTVPVASITGRLNNENCLTAAIAVIGINATIALRQWRYFQNAVPPSSEENSTETDTKETDSQ
ncbi:MAG: hypothetical protein J6V22_05730 [Clostridia bacterium]|nr:hypothetical protein [Clostridia bacterium]